MVLAIVVKLDLVGGTMVWKPWWADLMQVALESNRMLQGERPLSSSGAFRQMVMLSIYQRASELIGWEQ